MTLPRHLRALLVGVEDHVQAVSSTYPWLSFSVLGQAYLAAVLETHPARMPARIAAAQKTLQDRLAEIEVFNPEDEAIQNALAGLAALKEKRTDSFEAQ
jgi:hypothetical protein